MPGSPTATLQGWVIRLIGAPYGEHTYVTQQLRIYLGLLGKVDRRCPAIRRSRRFQYSGMPIPAELGGGDPVWRHWRMPSDVKPYSPSSLRYRGRYSRLRVIGNALPSLRPRQLAAALKLLSSWHDLCSGCRHGAAAITWQEPLVNDWVVSSRPVRSPRCTEGNESV